MDECSRRPRSLSRRDERHRKDFVEERNLRPAYQDDETYSSSQSPIRRQKRQRRRSRSTRRSYSPPPSDYRKESMRTHTPACSTRSRQRRRHYRSQSRDHGRDSRKYPKNGSQSDGDWHDDDYKDECRKTKKSRRNKSRRQRSESSTSDSGYEEIQKKKDRRRKQRHKKQKRHRGGSASTSGSGPAKLPKILERGTGVVSDDDMVNGASKTANSLVTTTQDSAWTSKDPHVAVPQSSRTLDHQSTTSTEKKRYGDSEGHFQGGKGTVIADRYKILREVGLGTFGRVLECLDLKRHQGLSGRNQDHRDAKPFVALKIVRNIKRYHESALIEARIVDSINRKGGRGLSHCVVMYDAFSLDGHYCMVFESLGPSLYDFLKRNNYQPFPMVCVQDFTIQLLQALEFLHDLRLCHTDLKMENVLLVSSREKKIGKQWVPASTRLKLIDFGGACYDSDKKSSVINTRQYRAPEVILGVGWSMPSDMWSIGCILVELYKGELMFATHDNLEHLALMEQIIGPFPRHMIQAARNNSHSSLAKKGFGSDGGRHRMERVLDSETASYVRESDRLEQMMRSHEDYWFFDLLRMILVIDPSRRATARECLHFLSRIRRDALRFG